MKNVTFRNKMTIQKLCYRLLVLVFFFSKCTVLLSLSLNSHCRCPKVQYLSNYDTTMSISRRFLSRKTKLYSYNWDNVESLDIQCNPKVTQTSNDNFGDNTDNNNSILAEESLTRRKVMVAAMAGLNAETAWKTAVSMASADASLLQSNNDILPPDTIQKLQTGRAVIVPNWLSIEEVRALRKDAQNCFQTGRFTNFILSRNPKKADKAANDRWIMPSFAAVRTTNGANLGPFADPELGDFSTRALFKAKMAQVKAYLAQELYNRPTLVDDGLEQSHEIEYLRYGQGAFLQRHTDEHHVELKRPNGSRLPKKANASRRSITWMVYLNENWDTQQNGGQLRLHERAFPAANPVGSNGNDLQVGWLKSTQITGKDENGSTIRELQEQPVFLDPFQPGPENENCILYTTEGENLQRRNLSSKPFANIALYLGGGDAMARKLMVENALDASRLHLIDAPKSLVSSILVKGSSDRDDYKGEDGGEKIKEVSPKAGTLVVFDSVSLPHEVLVTNKERFGIQGWFHEKLGYS